MVVWPRVALAALGMSVIGFGEFMFTKMAEEDVVSHTETGCTAFDSAAISALTLFEEEPLQATGAPMDWQ